MPIKEVYSDYFQKSKAFLLPAIGIRRCEYTTYMMTFISWPGHYEIDDCRLTVCNTTVLADPDYQRWEKFFLFNNRYYEKMEWYDDSTIAYVFNLSEFRSDWNLFLQGKYSQFSVTLKARIMNYFGEQTPEWEYIKSFVYPDRYFERYAELLYDEKDREAGLEHLKSVGELCEKYNPRLEVCKNLKDHLVIE